MTVAASTALCLAGIGSLTSPVLATEQGRHGQIAFNRDDPATGDSHIFLINPDGTGEHELLARTAYFAAWSPSGSRLAVTVFTPDTLRPAIIGALAQPGTVKTGGSPYFAFAPVWSPNGRHLVFGLSLEAAGDVQIYTARPNGHDVVRVTNSVDPVDWPGWGGAADD